MPTAKERIEELKKQVKAAPNDKALQEAAAAEIIAIRNACGVERKTGYGLDKRIPAAPDGKRITDEARQLQQDAECKKILGDESTRKNLLARGHGGQMVIDIREKYDKQIQPEAKNLNTESVLKKNTLSGRMAKVRAEAQEINTQLGSRTAKIRNEAMERSKEVLGEYLALIDKGRYEPPNSEAPSKLVDAWKTSTMKDPTAQKMMNTSEKVSGMMNAIAFGTVKQFQAKFGPELDAATASNAPKAPEKQQPGQVIEKQNPAGPAPQGPGI